MLKIEDAFLDIDSARLETRWIKHESAGSASLVLLHEGLGSTELWKSFPLELARLTGLNAFLYSRASYGKSSRLDTPRKPTYMHDEATRVLPRVLEAAGISAPVLVGHSDGASIALIYAGSGDLDDPAGLVLMAPHVFVEEKSIAGIEAARQAFVAGELRAGLEPYHDDVANAFWRWNDIWLDADFRNWNIEAYLPSIKAPMLLIQGRDDEYGTLEQLRAIRGQSGGAVEVLLLDDCGHSPFREQKQLTLSATAGFVKKLAR